MHVCKTNGDAPVFWRHSVVLKWKCPALSIKKTKNRGPKTCWHSRSLLLLPWNCYWSGLEKSALTVPVNHHLQQAKNAPGPSVLISPVSFQSGQRLQFPQNIYQDFKIILFTKSHYFAAISKEKKKDTDHSYRCSSRPPSFCTSCTHELGGSTELLSVTHWTGKWLPWLSAFYFCILSSMKKPKMKAVSRPATQWN